MSSFQERMQVAAAENTKLCQTISDTAYSISAFQQIQNHVESLKQQITEREKYLADIDRRVAKEYKDHESYRDSYVKRLAYKIGGKKEKFNERASKEEKEWLDAVATQLNAKKVLEGLVEKLAAVRQSRDDLLTVVQVHTKTKADLDALYHSVFDGPTPEMPEEDAKENEVHQAEASFNAIQLRLSTEQQVRNILGDAEAFLRRAVVDIQEAQDAATADLWNVGGSFAEMAENNALGRCQQHVSQAEMLVSNAQRMQVREVLFLWSLSNFLMMLRYADVLMN